jgi:hypothetical protein
MTDTAEVPEARTVWAARLGAKDAEEVECLMSLDRGELVFVSEQGEVRIPGHSIGKARRIRGSPVMLLEYAYQGNDVRIAVFFVKPPPLPGNSGKSRRKTRKDSVTYLSLRNRNLKYLIDGWVVALGEASKGDPRD